MIKIPYRAALAINNQEVKDQVRELWAIPLLVNLISDVRPPTAAKQWLCFTGHLICCS